MREFDIKMNATLFISRLVQANSLKEAQERADQLAKEICSGNEAYDEAGSSMCFCDVTVIDVEDLT